MSVEAPGPKATTRLTGLALGQSVWAIALGRTATPTKTKRKFLTTVESPAMLFS
jgi:hypothetical protein